MRVRMSVGMGTASTCSSRTSAALAPGMSITRLPSTRPMRVRPAASNVASLNGVSGRFDIAPRCAPTGPTASKTRSEASKRMAPSKGRHHTAARMGDAQIAKGCQDHVMTNDLLSTFSNQLADAVATAAPSVVQVQGRRRPASGLVYADNVVLTTVRALGREDGLRVRRDDGRAFDAELAGWDPTTSLAVLRVADLQAPPIAPSKMTPRVGHLALVVGRSWSNVATASA